MAPSNAAAGALFSPASLNLPSRERGRDRDRDRDRNHDRPDQQLSVVRSSSKERKASFSSLKASLPGSRRRANASNASGTATPSSNGNSNSAPPLPDYALAAAAKIVAKDKDRDRDREKDHRDAAEGASAAELANTMIPRGSAMTAMTPATPIEGRPGMTSTMWALAQGETQVLHHQITELAQKRMSTLDYLRKA